MSSVRTRLPAQKLKMFKYLDHEFDSYTLEVTVREYFQCILCNIVIFLNSNNIYYISVYYNNMKFSTKELKITCNEVIIKNIIE